jgi:carbonic anhydrase
MSGNGPMTRIDRRPTTPAGVLDELLAGNRRFVDGYPIHPNQDAGYRATLASEQRPLAVLVGCSDSRLAAEIIFDCGLGDLFVIRTAGHIIGAEVLASIEYGVTVLGAPLVAVVGHDSCGAIQATVDAMAGNPLPNGNLGGIIDRVIPSIQSAHARQITDREGIAKVHVQRTVDMIVRQAEAVAAGQCTVVGMSYRLADGRITMLTPGSPTSDPELEYEPPAVAL